MWARVEERQRTQMQEDQLGGDVPFVMPVAELAKHFDEFQQADWSGGEVTLATMGRYQPHLTFTAEVDGLERSSCLWAHRDATAVDVVVADGQVAAFVRAHRYGMEVLVRPGLEKLTPLTVYDDPLLSQPSFGVNRLGTYLVAMRDGVRLATDVYLPEGAVQPLPAILVRTCYDRSRNHQAFMRWANRGYAVVVQDVRGRSDSEGELVPFYFERDDGSDTIDWIAAQGWSNGDVGMWGASYLGYVVVAAATSGNPHLKAVVDEVNVGSPFVDTVRRGGTLCSWPLLSWTLAQSVGTRTDFSIFGGETYSPEKVVDIRPIRDIPSRAIGRRSGPWDIWAEHPDYDDFWRECDFSRRGGHVRVPMFVISGWFDGDSAGVSETWRMLSEHDVPNRKIWLGPWEHQPNRARDLEDAHFSNDAIVYHYDAAVLRWFDRWLKGVKNGIEEEARAQYYVMGENRWLASADWPPLESTPISLYFGSGGSANSRVGDGLLRAPQVLPEPKTRGDAPYDRYIYNPNDPLDDPGERHPDNLRRHELRGDMLVYTSEPLTDDLTVAGELWAEIFAATTGRDTDWVVVLSDVHPNGDSIRLSHYMVRAQYRNGFDARALVEPGKVERYPIFLPNLAHTFFSGHRVRVSVTSSSKMVAFPNSNTGLNPYDDPEPITVTQTIYHSAEYPSRIVLPVLDLKAGRERR
jgi:putative CocE/NonD family hydrolase